MQYRLSRTAELDVRTILAETARRFGPLQRSSYAQLLQAAAAMVAEDPDRPGSRRRDEIGAGIRSFHVELAGRRRGAAAHVLFYLRSQPRAGDAEVLVLRVLHERMDPTRHKMPTG